jgi:hypothetical protein
METLYYMRKNMKVSFLKVEAVNNMFCRYCFVKIHNSVPWIMKLLLKAVHTIFVPAQGGREEKYKAFIPMRVHGANTGQMDANIEHLV